MSDTLARLRSISNAKGSKATANTCRFAALIANHPDRDAYLAAIDDPLITSVAIAEDLTAAGYRVGNTTVNRHRRKVCYCYTSGQP